GIGPQVDFLVFDSPPEALDEDVVTPGALAIHADLDLAGGQHLDEVGRGELAALSRARGFIPAAFLTTILLLVLCAALAFAISALTGIAWQTMVLATAPGSVTEMALTAKILDEGVAVVTAYHVVRIFVIIPLAPLIFAV